MAAKGKKPPVVWTPARVAKMAVNPGNRSKIPLEKLPAQYRQQRIQRLVKDPRTRASVPLGMLPAQYRQAREQRIRFQSPITPGSSLTYGEVARRRKAEETLAFGADPVGKAQQNERQIGSWYDDYQRQLEQHRQRVEGYGQQAGQQVAGLVGQANGQVSALPADASAENRDVAARAAAARAGVASAMGAEVAARSQGANEFASTMQAAGGAAALFGKTQAHDKVGDVSSKLGAWRQKYMADAREAEAKNVLAVQLAAGKTAAQIALEDQKQAGRVALNNADNKAAAAREAGKLNKYGYTTAEWSKLSEGEKAKIRAAAKAKDKTGAPGPDWLAPPGSNKMLGQIPQIRDYATALHAGKAPEGTELKVAGPMGRAQIGRTLEQAGGLDSAMISAVLDSMYGDHGRPAGVLSRYTVRKLMAAGMKPSVVAQRVGAKTYGQWLKAGGPVSVGVSGNGNIGG